MRRPGDRAWLRGREVTLESVPVHKDGRMWVVLKGQPGLVALEDLEDGPPNPGPGEIAEETA